jgi:uncharacterized protein (UPF0264 family)
MVGMKETHERMVGRLYTSPMQLLVSVRDAHEAHLALEGGADVIDAKEPLAGALGPVSLPTFEAIVAAVASRRPVSAALGDGRSGKAVEREAQAFARAGAAFVKIGFAGIASDATVAAVIAAAAAGASVGGSGLVAVAYADFALVGALSPERILDAAARAGARGVLLDTARKDGPSSLALVSEDRLAAWVDRARSAGMFTAIAGRLMLGDLPAVLASGADIAGVRGAACDDGRDGRVSAERVRRLRGALRARTHHTGSSEDLAAASARTPHRG